MPAKGRSFFKEDGRVASYLPASGGADILQRRTGTMGPSDIKYNKMDIKERDVVGHPRLLEQGYEL